MGDNRPARRKHLRRLDRITVPGAPVFFVTACVQDRRPVLADPRVALILIEGWQHADALHGWLVGRYVVMPDHVHFLASPRGDDAKSLSVLVKCWKTSTAARIRRACLPGFRWQREFFDHVLRNDESFARKWEYVRHNPVRAGLVTDADSWPYQGEITIL
jgi:REP element-mobilizing transposase RayT